MKAMVNLTPKQIKSFWGRVKKGVRCWEWIGGKNKLGYGLNTVQQKKIKWTFLAHRLSFFLSSGKDPGKFQVCHSCDNPSCCNPNHLWLGTVHQNMQDKQQKHRAGKKLFPDAIFEIRNSKISKYILAEKYGVHEATIRKVRRRNIWKHI
jgi:HNH endonuclease